MMNLNRSDVLIQAGKLRRSRNRHNPGLLGQQPGERYLRWSRLLLLRNPRQQIH